jgi:hypothetical protein
VARVVVLARFLIDTHPIHGLRSIIVNGADWTDSVAGVQVTSQPGQPTTVDVRVIGADMDRFEGEGIVRAHDDSDDRQAIIDFLDAIDPDELDRQVLASFGFGDGGSPIVRCIQVLREAASGHPA